MKDRQHHCLSPKALYAHEYVHTNVDCIPINPNMLYRQPICYEEGRPCNFAKRRIWYLEEIPLPCYAFLQSSKEKEKSERGRAHARACKRKRGCLLKKPMP